MTLGTTLPLAELRAALDLLAQEGVLIGTSSWKYPGWVGLLYDEQRYLWRGKFAESRFERDCLAEYAEVFPTVCVDAGYYNFPAPTYIEGLVKQVRPGFKFGFKVTDEITARTFPNLPRHGAKAGQRNEHFLNAELFSAAFLSSLAPYREFIGVLMFEFSHFHPRDFQRGREFVQMLDQFLSQLPTGWQYGVEIRNQNLLCQPYLEVLAKHGVAHVLNNWSRMPSVAEQLEVPGAAETTSFTAARFLLKPGRDYKTAVASFSPYRETQEVNEEARSAAVRLIQLRRAAAKTKPTKPSFVFVNNRLEGNSIFTIMSMLQRLGAL
jgi:uncharacterized protein YecE (DUF72 family)